MIHSNNEKPDHFDSTDHLQVMDTCVERKIEGTVQAGRKRQSKKDNASVVVSLPLPS